MGRLFTQPNSSDMEILPSNLHMVAPGKPGAPPTWTSSKKIGVGTAMSSDSNIWFTLSHGIINEVYYPRIDIANIRDCQLIVTNGKDFFSEEKRDTVHEYAMLAEGVPAYLMTNTCKHGNYIIQKKIIADPKHDVLLQRIKFTPLKGNLADYQLFVLIAPHLYNAGQGNHGWIGEYKGDTMFFAERAGVVLALGSSVPFLKMTCGYVGKSDGWQDLITHKKLINEYREATDGNIAFCGEIDLQKEEGTFVLSLGFGQRPERAGLQVRASLFQKFDRALSDYLSGWLSVQEKIIDLTGIDTAGARHYKTSVSVLKVHEGKHFAGSIISSLSIPWGFDRGDYDLGGYHLIWPRDQVQAARAFIACGDMESASDVMLFLVSTQEKDGNWAQCMWADGMPYWKKLQLDEVALPIILASDLKEEFHQRRLNLQNMIEKAAEFLLHHGPQTEQDRWEENNGFTAFTIATVITALLIAADFFEKAEKNEEAAYLRIAADWWNACIEDWLYVKDTGLALKNNVDGYYVRIAPPEKFGKERKLPPHTIVIKNRPVHQSFHHYENIVSCDALALVRFGLRAADDPHILNTVKVIDAVLKTETQRGPIWHRYSEDGYGEHEDGSPFNGTGIGRGWPLLTGERAHYELAKGDREEALKLLRVLADMTGVEGLIPEQIWDSADVPQYALYNGHSTGSAKPLVWAHAEYILLLRSLKENRVFDMPEQTHKRYVENANEWKYALWNFNYPFKTILEGKIVRLHLDYPFKVRWTNDDWKNYDDVEASTNRLNVWYVDLPTDRHTQKTRFKFTLFWTLSQKWEGDDFEIEII
jgi:glucoamylase